jgi:hypothetical protein
VRILDKRHILAVDFTGPVALAYFASDALHVQHVATFTDDNKFLLSFHALVLMPSTPVAGCAREMNETSISTDSLVAGLIHALGAHFTLQMRRRNPRMDQLGIPTSLVAFWAWPMQWDIIDIVRILAD